MKMLLKMQNQWFYNIYLQFAKQFRKKLAKMIKIKTQHKHHIQQQLSQQQQPEPQKITIIPLSTTQKQPKQSLKNKSPQPRKLHSSPNSLQNPNKLNASKYLKLQLQQSFSYINEPIFAVIRDRRKRLQSSVYISLVQDWKGYLQGLIVNAYDDNRNKKYVYQMIEQTVTQVNQNLIDSILDGEYNVHKITRASKQQIFNQGTLRIKQQILKAKLSDLKSQINASALLNAYGNQSVHNSIDISMYDAGSLQENNEKNKKAKEFVKRMKQMQQEQRREKQLKQQFKRQKQLQKMEERKQIQQMMKKQKHEQIKKKFEQKRLEKQKQRKQQLTKNEQFKKFLQQYKNKVPLYQQKQKQYFEKFILAQHKRKMDKLKQIKEQRKSIDYQQLRQHQKQYLQLKQDYQYQRNAQKAMQQKTLQPKKVYFRSKFHSLIQKQQKQKQQTVDELQIKTKLYQKRWSYANQVKTHFIPKIDPVKKQQMKIKQQEKKIKQKILEVKLNPDIAKEDGRRNLEKVHKYIAELKAKGKFRSASTSQTIDTPLPRSARYKNYLSQLRQSDTSKNMRKSRANSIDFASIENGSTVDVERIKYNLKNRQLAALRRQQYIQNLAHQNLDKFMEEKKKLDEEFLQSAKGKAALISKLQ